MRAGHGRTLINALGWAGLGVGVPVVLAALARGGPAPGHDTRACRPCRAATPYKGPALPYELDGLNVRTAAAGSAGRRGAVEPADDPRSRP